MRILNDEELEELLGEDFATAYSGHVEEYRSVAKAQHQQDMKDFIEYLEIYFPNRPGFSEPGFA